MISFLPNSEKITTMVIENRYVENASRFVINFLFIQNFLSSIKDECILFGKNIAWVKSFNAFFPSKIDTFLSVKEKSCNMLLSHEAT